MMFVKYIVSFKKKDCIIIMKYIKKYIIIRELSKFIDCK